jgi:hypothetical protein
MFADLTHADAGVSGAPDAPGTSAEILSVSSVSPWVTADGEFQIRFAPSDEVPADARITVTIHQSVEPGDSLREAVDDIIDGAAPGKVLQAPVTRPVTDYGDTSDGLVLTIPIRSRTADSERILLPNPGIHPVQLVLTSADGPELWSTVVFLNRLPAGDGPTRPPPVNVSLVLPIGSGPAIGTDGTGSFSIEERAALTSVAALLREVADVPLLLVPRPNTLDGLLLTDEAWSQELLELIGEEDREHGVLAMPYAAVDSGGLVASGAAAELSRQLELGRDTVERAARRPSVPGVWALDDTLTPDALNALSRSGVDSVLLPAGLMTPPPGTDEEELAAWPRSLAGGSGMRALAFDSDVSGRLAGTTANPGERAHEIVTMLMATWFDHSPTPRGTATPGAGPSAAILVTSGTDPRVLQALAPSLSGNGPLRSRTDQSPVPAVRAGQDESAELAPRRPTAQRGAVAAADATRRLTDAYRSMTAEGDSDLWALERVNDQTMSTAVGDGKRLEMHLAVRDAIDRKVAQVEPPRARRVVVTSRRTTIPLRFRNDLPFDVRLVLQARSTRLAIEGGESRTVVLAPGENRIDLPVTVRAPGESLLRIELSSPVPGIELDGPGVPIRSTAISGVGAAMSAVSFAFLIGWWVHTHRRRRRNDRQASGVHPSGTGGTGTVPPGG